MCPFLHKFTLLWQPFPRPADFSGFLNLWSKTPEWHYHRHLVQIASCTEQRKRWDHGAVRKFCNPGSCFRLSSVNIVVLQSRLLSMSTAMVTPLWLYPSC